MEGYFSKLFEITDSPFQSRKASATLEPVHAGGEVCGVKEIRGDNSKWPPLLCKPVRLSSRFVQEEAPNVNDQGEVRSPGCSTCPGEHKHRNFALLSTRGNHVKSLDDVHTYAQAETKKTLQSIDFDRIQPKARTFSRFLLPPHFQEGNGRFEAGTLDDEGQHAGQAAR